VARAVMIIASVVVLVIALGILLVLLEANPANVIVQAVTEAARFLAGPFEALFTLRSPKLQTAVNWGIAAVVYLIVAALIAGLLRRIGRAPRRRAK
jgi:hypothetical protein